MISALSVVSVMELEHGIWRARDATRADRRRQFLEDLISTIPVYPLTVKLARMAGRIDAELQDRGIRIAFPDLLIGVSALELGYGIATANSRHLREAATFRGQRQPNPASPAVRTEI